VICRRGALELAQLEALEPVDDERIRTLVIDDAFGLGFVTMEVDGDVNTRARQVLRALR